MSTKKTETPKMKIPAKAVGIVNAAMTPHNNAIIIVEDNEKLNMQVTPDIDLAMFISLWSMAAKLLYRQLSPEAKQAISYTAYIRTMSNSLAQGYDIHGESITPEQIAKEQLKLMEQLQQEAKHEEVLEQVSAKPVRKPRAKATPKPRSSTTKKETRSTTAK